jgi:hypothetical protein
MSETVLYLVRHGAIGPAGARSFVGQIDLPLVPPSARRIAEINSLSDVLAAQK